MPIATTLAALVITVTAQATVSPALVDAAIAEADAIWKPAGLSMLWSRQPPPRPAAGAATALSVTIGNARGSASPRESEEPLGWILFERGEPQPQIYVSYANTLDLLMNSSGVVGHVGSMPILEKNTYLARAMGRALAHELGHYLLASREHTHAGLMMATRSAFDFFGPTHARFELTATERAAIKARAVELRLADAEPLAAPAPRRRASMHP